MALAISDDFEALCGFAPLSTITSTLRSYPELARLVGEARISALESAHTQEEETEVGAIAGHSSHTTARAVQ